MANADRNLKTKYIEKQQAFTNNNTSHWLRLFIISNLSNQQPKNKEKSEERKLCTIIIDYVMTTE